MATFTVPSPQARNLYSVNTFLGVDFTNEPGNVDDRQSPYAENMIRDVPGKMRKCMGWHTVKTYDSRINGAYRRRQDDELLIHAGTKIYKGEAVVYSGANDAISAAYQMEDKLVILDGKQLLLWDGSTVKPAAQGAYTPTLTIGKSPAGGGVDYEALNLLNPAFKELFAGDEKSTVYQLSFGGLDSVDKVETLNSSGAWVAKKAGTDYTVSLTAGTVTFTTAPGKSPVTGEDNVRITASRTVAGYADRVNHCRFGILFGVNGAADRLFVSGNEKYRNYDWYSGQYDPTYFADTAYSVLGQAGSSVVGYSMIRNYLAAHKDSMDTERNVIVREGTLISDGDSQTAAFPITNSMQGEGAVAQRSFGYLTTEPVFLTKQGVFAITTSDVSGERYTQRRSWFLNGKLLEEDGLENAFAVVHNELYWLFLNGKAYILDGMQSITTKNDPYSTRQYAGFYRTNVPARCAWVRLEDDGDVLCFGTQDGRVCEFYRSREALASYNDDGEPIYCCYTTPDFSGKLFYKNKTFRYLAVKLSRFVQTGIRMYINNKGLWQLVKKNEAGARFFSFQAVQFSRLNFSPDSTTKTMHTKTRLKRVDKTSYKFENDALNEPFGLMEYAIEYEQKSYYKG